VWLLALALAGGLVVGCGVLAGIDDFHFVGLDASLATEASGGEGGAPASCAGFLCGAICVDAGDPAFGCAPENGCRPCPAGAHTEAFCAGASCAARCADGYLDCDVDAGNGCEIDGRTDREHCGACAAPCTLASAPVCVDGACVVDCSPKTYCAGSCEDLRTSPLHCGSCTQVCPSPDGGNGSAVCNDGGCNYACAAGRGDCNADLSDGCETVVNGSDLLHCGSCAPCPSAPPHTSKVACAGGQCKLTCSGAFADCDGTAANGCECDLSRNNCSGTSCVPCGPAGSTCSKDVDCCGATAGTALCAGGDFGSLCGPR
jgi:hypothetical protein